VPAPHHRVHCPLGKCQLQITYARDAANVPLGDRLHFPPPEWVEAQDDYMDPLAGPALDGTMGPWLAGVAPVGNTELAVIVQTRLDDATALDCAPFRVLTAWSVGGAALLLAGVLMAVRARAGSRRS
jgi:eukaryotic-like serine/threonine-protein kinase